MSMKTRTRSTLAAVGLFAIVTGLPGAAIAQLSIDTFADDQAALSDPGTSGSVVPGASILGAERDLTAARIEGTGTVTVEVTGGRLILAIPAATLGQAAATWDGLDGDETSLDVSGLSSDLTVAGSQGGIELLVEAASAGAQVHLEAWSSATTVSRASLVMPAIAAPQSIFVDFSQFRPLPGIGAADLSAVGALRLTLVGSDAAVTLDGISTVAPAVTATKSDVDTSGTGLGANPVTPGAPFRYRITLENSGGEVEAGQLTDFLDSNLAAGSVRTTPLARPDHYFSIENRQLDSALANEPTLLGNDVDLDGDSLVALVVTGGSTRQGGLVDIAADGSFIYSPPMAFEGADAFDYLLASVSGDPEVTAEGNPVAPFAATVNIEILRRPTLRSSPSYGVERELVCSGGASQATSTNYRLRSSLGQAGLTGILTSPASQEVDSGFWNRSP